MKTDYLNPKLYNRLYAYMTYENVLALRTCLETGLRVDDVLSLKKCQLSGRTITGIAEKTQKKYKKTISQDLANMLCRSGNSTWIFPHRTDPTRHRTRQAVWDNMKKAAAACGLTMNAAPHSTRKTYAVELFHDSGLEATQRALQHDRTSTTMLYCFSDLLTNTNGRSISSTAAELDELAELIADKVVEKIIKRGY
jgi:integrase